MLIIFSFLYIFYLGVIFGFWLFFCFKVNAHLGKRFVSLKHYRLKKLPLTWIFKLKKLSIFDCPTLKQPKTHPHEFPVSNYKIAPSQVVYDILYDAVDIYIHIYLLQTLCVDWRIKTYIRFTSTLRSTQCDPCNVSVI